jgi:hypothetical protein
MRNVTPHSLTTVRLSTVSAGRFLAALPATERVSIRKAVRSFSSMKTP